MNKTPFCHSRDEPILIGTDEVEKENVKSKTKVLFGKVIRYETTKKTLGNCVYFKNGRCVLKRKPTLCECYPIFFNVNLEDNSIVWLKDAAYKGRITEKKLKQIKRKLLDFVKKEKPSKILLYLSFQKKYKLKVIEEERIEEKVYRKLKRIGKIYESKRNI